MASGTGALSYIWSKNGVVIAGAASASYTTPATTMADNGALFAVAASNSMGNMISGPAALTVTAAPVAPSISAQPVSQTTTAGQAATFTVTATGTAPLTYQWNKNGAVIAGATSASYTTPATAAGDNGAAFTVTVSNSVSTLTSSAATLTVSPANSFVISAAPTSFSFAATVNGTAPSLQTVVFVATPATPLPFTLAADQPWITMTANSGTTKATLQFGVNPAGLVAGSYTGHVIATPSGAGNPRLSVPVTLVVSPASPALAITPAITAQPISQTVPAGQTASFSVTATGTAPLRYQWSKNGAAISGATSASYTTPATAAGDNGAAFTVTVSNSVSTLTSSAATLTVSPANSFVISAAPTSFSFAATVNGTAPSLQTVVFVATPATPLPFTLAADQPWITMTANSGTTKATLQFGVNPAGLAAGSYTGHVIATPSGAGNPPLSIPVSLTVTASPVPGTLTTSVTSLNFSSVTVGGNSTLPVTFTNSGTTNITISNMSISGAGFNASGVSTGTILAAGQTATLNVTFAPSATGSATGAATLTSNAKNSPATISLSGSAAQPPQHSVSLTWTDTSIVAGYNVYQATVSGGLYTKLTSSLDPSPSYTDTTVKAGQTYYYVVTAVDSSGVESVYSTPTSVVIPTP